MNTLTVQQGREGQYFPFSPTAAFYLFESSSLSYTSAAAFAYLPSLQESDGDDEASGFCERQYLLDM